MFFSYIRSIFCSFLLLSPLLAAQPHGKFDFGAAFLEADIRTQGKVVHTASFTGISAGGTVCVADLISFSPLCQGVAVKPRLLAALGDHHIWNIGVGLGYIVPIRSVVFVPNVGVTYGELGTKFMTLLGDTQVRYKSLSPYVGIDASICFWQCWQITVAVEYAWPRTETFFSDISLGTVESTGWNGAFQLDYYVTESWSILGSFAFSDSRDKEANGMSIQGGRLGVGYFF